MMPAKINLVPENKKGGKSRTRTRELENVVEYAMNMEQGEIITLNSLPEGFRQKPTNGQEIKEKLIGLERETIKAALDKYGWDVQGKTRAAKELGIGLRTLYRKIKEH